MEKKQKREKSSAPIVEPDFRRCRRRIHLQMPQNPEPKSTADKRCLGGRWQRESGSPENEGIKEMRILAAGIFVKTAGKQEKFPGKTKKQEMADCGRGSSDRSGTGDIFQRV